MHSRQYRIQRRWQRRQFHGRRFRQIRDREFVQQLENRFMHAAQRLATVQFSD